ncbi:MAG: transglutaminase domain-containing protein [Planctomycetota bacterium]|jgi:hypothetical protein|nr:transglutaminase domain-containing protein [Planctomycetota bacterium]
MHRNTRSLALVLFLVTLTGGRLLAATSPHPWDNKRVYYLIEYQGELREKGFFIRRPGSYQKRPCIIYDEEKNSRVVENGIPQSRTFISRSITSPEGQAWFRHEEVVTGAMGEETVKIEGGVAEIEANGYFGASSSISVPEGVLFEVSGDWLAHQRLQSGNRLKVSVLNREERRVIEEEVSIGSPLPTPRQGGAGLWTGEFSTAGEPGLSVFFTTDGRLLRLESAGMVYQVVTREEYDQERIKPDNPYLDRLPENEPDVLPNMPSITLDTAIPAWDTFSWLLLKGTPYGEWERQVSESPYVRIETRNDGCYLTSLRNAPHLDVNATLPLTVPAEIQPYLAANSGFPAQNTLAIRSSREAAVADPEGRDIESNALRAVSYLAGWINQSIGLEKGFNPDATVLDALRSRTADHYGHARIFATLARSLGIPSRLCQGLLIETGKAVFHTWAEAWINGTWIPVDTTVSRVGLPAGYILAELSGPDGVLSSAFPDYLNQPVLALTIVSAGRETPNGNLTELRVGERLTYATQEGDWLANLYWGFALRLPGGWAGRARLNSVEITSPDRLANIKCEALAGDFPVGNKELDANLAILQANLESFRLIDQRLVSFDPDGALPALFIDFACQQNNATLRCRQYILPRRQRAFRLSFWAPADIFDSFVPFFDQILASCEF